MKRSGPLRRRSHLRRVSAKQRLREAEWRQAREAALKRDGYWPTCPALGIHDGDCEGGIEVHHRLPRSAGGTHDLDNLLVLCAKGHRFVHTHPEMSYARGWLLRRTA